MSATLTCKEAAGAMEAGPEPHPIEALSFVANADTGLRNFWTVRRTGKMRVDDALGATMAREAIAYMQLDDFTPLLGWIVRDMMKAGEFGHLEVAFCSGIARAAVKGSGIRSPAKLSLQDAIAAFWRGLDAIDEAGEALSARYPVPPQPGKGKTKAKPKPKD